MLVRNSLEQKLVAFPWTVCSSSNNAPHPVTLPVSALKSSFNEFMIFVHVQEDQRDLCASVS